MAEETRGGGSGWLAFIVGGLLVVVAVLGYMMYTGNGPFQTADRSLDVKIDAPTIQAPKAPELPKPELPSAPPQNVPSPPS